MTTLDDIKAAHAKIAEAEAHYRDVLRAGIADGVKQADVVRELGRTRETVRQDAMPDEERAALREVERQRREAAKAIPADLAAQIERAATVPESRVRRARPQRKTK